MKRMIYIWLLLIGITLTLGFLRPEWSVNENAWAALVFSLLVVLLGIELGLIYWRRRVAIMHWILQNLPKPSRQAEDAHYIPKQKD